jgi:hypothetical protein
MLEAGTKPLPRKGSRVRNIGVLLAVSTLFAARPSAVASQISASANSASRPMAASQDVASAVGRKPMATATPRTIRMLMKVWMRLASTWPVSTHDRAMAIVRNRSMIPPVMSMATTIAVPWTAAATVMSRMPGAT